MNDMITPRQQQIIDLLSSMGPLSRQEISDQLQNFYDVSKVTLIRDLATLIAAHLIKVQSAGPATTYTLVSNHPLLNYLDLSIYFESDPDHRSLTTQTNSDFFQVLAAHDLLTRHEIQKANLANTAFQKRLASLEPGIYQKELERFTIELSWKSARIEGNTYSLLETEELLKNSRPALNHPESEAKMLLNHKKALETIYQNRLTFGKLELIDILNVHQVLTQDLGIEPGLRRQAVGITGTNYHPPDNQFQLRDNLEQAINLVNQKAHPLEKALLASGLIVYLQPFVDGNKRTARLVSNALLLAHDFAALSYRSVDEIKYKQTVILLDEQHNFYWYKKMFLEQFYFSLSKYFL